MKTVRKHCHDLSGKLGLMLNSLELARVVAGKARASGDLSLLDKVDRYLGVASQAYEELGNEYAAVKGILYKSCNPDEDLDHLVDSPKE
jgi:hypothetical protein